MKLVKVGEKNIVGIASDVLRKGGVVVFPTDTAYGLGVDATNDAAVERLYELKGRERGKPIHVVVSDLEMAERYVAIDKNARLLAKTFLPGAITLILRNKDGVSRNIVSDRNTLGIRIPDNVFARALVASARVPVTATSANKSDDPAPYSIEEVKKSFGKDFKKIDLAVDAGVLPRTKPSTLVDLTTKEVQILRDGPIGREEILKVLL